jgi:diphthine synthase
MAKLYLAGIGPGPGYVTERALRVLREADCLFYEDYTGPAHVELLRKLAGREPLKLTRRDLEDESGRRILECLNAGKSAALVTAGDPLLATSHAALVALVRSRGHSVEIVPGVSIVCAALSVSCLSVYRLGGVATVTYPRGGVYSMRPYELAEMNLKRGLHTLLLLDVRDDGSYMPPRDAAAVLLELEGAARRGVFVKTREVIVVYRLGWGGSVLRAALGELLKCDVEGPAVIIVPASLGPVERECLASVASGQGGREAGS